MTELISTQKIIGVGPRLLNAADRIAPALGTVNGLVGPFLAKGGGSATGAVSLIGSSLRAFSTGIPNPLSTTMSALGQPGVYPIVSGAGAAIAGMITEEVGKEIGGLVGGFLKTGGSAAQKFGVASAFMGIITAYFLEARGGGSRLFRLGSGIASGAGQNYRLEQDNPDVVPNTMSRGVVSMRGGTSF